MYSTALVTFPSLYFKKFAIKKNWLSGISYGVAGWFGSAMGIVMAKDLNLIPNTFILVGGLVVVSNYLIQGLFEKKNKI